jgi:hypothetical protein
LEKETPPAGCSAGANQYVFLSLNLLKEIFDQAGGQFPVEQT